MTIDKEQLISLLTEKTGLETGQVKAQLAELVNRIQQAAEEGKTFEIEGFGVFSLEEGNLQFEPSDTLETEINNKYAGMKPIELIGAFKEPEGDEVPDLEEQADDEDSRWIFDEAATEEKTEEKPVDETDASEEETDAEEVYRQIFGEKKEEAEPAASFEESPPETPEPKDDKQSTKDPIGRLLVAAVVVIALGVGGWVAYDMGFSGTDEASGQQYNTSSQTPAQQAGDSRPEPSQDPSSSKEEDNASELEEQKEVVNTEESQKEAEQQPFGLRGEFNRAAGGYTIVVHSLRSVRKAENNQQNLREAGFRTLVSKAEVRGTTYYRVGIGQFETISDAQQALNEIPARYQDENFIKRIR